MQTGSSYGGAGQPAGPGAMTTASGNPFMTPGLSPVMTPGQVGTGGFVAPTGPSSQPAGYGLVPFGS